MAININEVYNTTLLILNKEQRGYVPPNEFNKIANQVLLQIFESYAEELNQQLRAPQSDSDYSDRVMNTDGKLSLFKTFGDATYDAATTPANPYFTTPSDLYRLGQVVYNGLDGDQIDMQRLQRFDFYNIQRSPLTKSTKTFPAYLYENEKIYVRPTSIITDVTVDYLRQPDTPRWGYSVGSLGQYVYDSTVYGETLLNTGTNTLTSSITTGLTGGDINTYTPTYTGGSGTGLVISANVTTPTNVTLSVTTAGTGYVVGDVITIDNGQLTNTGTGSIGPVITLVAADFNADSTYGSTQIEMHPSEQTDFIIKLLFYFGVVIRDPQIVQAAEQEYRKEEINEKS